MTKRQKIKDLELIISDLKIQLMVKDATINSYKNLQQDCLTSMQEYLDNQTKYLRAKNEFYYDDATVIKASVMVKKYEDIEKTKKDYENQGFKFIEMIEHKNQPQALNLLDKVNSNFYKLEFIKTEKESK